MTRVRLSTLWFIFHSSPRPSGGKIKYLEKVVQETRAARDTTDQDKDSLNKTISSLRANLHTQETSSSMFINTLSDFGCLTSKYTR